MLQKEFEINSVEELSQVSEYLLGLRDESDIIAFYGPMGAGKTTVGVAISKLSERTWYDTDQMIEDKHGKISDIFEYYGENHFRTLETNCIQYGGFQYGRPSP